MKRNFKKPHKISSKLSHHFHATFTVDKGIQEIFGTFNFHEM